MPETIDTTARAEQDSTRRFPDSYDPSSERRIVTPSTFARENLFFVQEAGHIRLRRSHPGTNRSSLDSYLIVQIARGSGTLEYEGKRTALRAGQCFWVDCRRPHGYRSAPGDPWELRWAHFNGRSAPGFYGLFAQSGGPVWTPENPTAVTQRLEAVLTAARNWNMEAELTASAELTGLLTAIVQERGRTEPLPPGACARLDEVRAYLAEHYAETITLDTLADRFFVSKYYLARSFRRRYGVTVMNFLSEARLDAAKQMLRYTDLSMAGIAVKCGFREQSYFTRRFRTAEGLTATQYRRAWRGERAAGKRAGKPRSEEAEQW